MYTNLTQAQINKVQIDSGLIYANYGELTELLIAPTRGGGEFSVKPSVRDIEHDSKRGKEKGLQVIESIEATLKVTTIGASQDQIALALLDSAESGDALTSGSVGIIASTKYLSNITMFAKLVDGTYKKITLYNALHEGAFTLGAKPKAEGEIALEFNAHWDPTNTSTLLYKVEDITAFPETSL